MNNRYNRIFRSAACGAFALSLASIGAMAVAQTPTTASVSGDERPDVTIDASARDKAIQSLIAQVDETYPIPDVRTRIVTELRKRQRAGAYAKIVSAKELRTRLTSDLRALSHDEHFNVEYFVVPRPYPAREETSSDPNSSREAIAAVHNQGVDSAERLSGNIGYIRLRTFEEPGKTGDVLASAMRFLARTDALIIDLRSNRGGYGETVALLASYFLAEPTQLSEVRSKDGVKQVWTSTYVPGPKYLDKPVYVLLSKRSFSAAEAFAYDLQALKRVTVIGEVSRGGANPSAQVLLSDRFSAIIPRAITRNPITKSNWDGKGVTPDIATTNEGAFDAARLAAAKAIAPKHRDDSLTGEIGEIISQLGGTGAK